MPAILKLKSFNRNGFTETINEWNDTRTAAKSRGSDIQQVILDKKLNSSLVINLFKDQLISFEQGIAVLKQQFRSSEGDQEDVLSFLTELIVEQLKRSPPKGNLDNLVGRPWFGISSSDYDDLSSILKEKEEMTEDVVIAFFQHPDEGIRRIAPTYLRPFLMFAFATYKQKSTLKSIWRYLNRFQDDQTRRLIRDIVVLATDHSFQADLLSICFEFLDVERQQRDAIDFLLLLVIRLKAEERIPHLRRYLNVICQVIDQVDLNSTQLEVILYTLGSCLEVITVSLLPLLVALVMKILQKSDFSSITLNVILDSVIQWFSRPCPFIPQETYRSFEVVLKRAQHPQPHALLLEDVSNWNDLMLHDRQVTSMIYQTKLNISLEADSSALPRLIANWKRVDPADFNAIDIRLIRALILSPLFSHHLGDVLGQLKQIMDCTMVSHPMSITPVLFKLVQERDPKCQLLLLKIVPEFAFNYSNVPYILSTIRKFDKNPGLDLICLELYYKLATKQYRASSRVIEHLEYLQGKRNKSFEMCLAMITIIRRICQQKGNQNCREMVKFISHIINEDCANSNDGMVMVVALDAIQILCENQTINVPSTWSAIKENFKEEQRKNVRLKLYSFFGIIPRMVRLETVADEALPDEIMALLWRDLMQETDPELIQAIFMALKEFPYHTMRFIRFPAMFREQVKLPKSHLSNVSEEEYMESFPYIPGECWLEMLEKVPQMALPFISIFLGKFIDLELQSLRGLSSELAEGRQEPKSITGVQPKSILKALLNYLVAETRNDFAETEHVRSSIVNCLAVGSFSKPLPSFDWSFLRNVYEKTLELRDDCLRIVCRQVENSISARAFLDNYLSTLQLSSCSLQEVLILIQNFHIISKALTINEAEILLRNCLESQSALDAFESMIRLLNADDLNVDLRRVVEEVIMQRYAQMTEEEKESKKWTLLINKMGSAFVKELIQPPTEELQIKKQVDDLLKNPQEVVSTEKIILMQLVASRLKLSKDEDELKFYGNLMQRLVVELSKLSAVDFVDSSGEEERSVNWGRYLQELDDQYSVKEGLNQVFTCLMTRLANDNCPVAQQLKLGLTGIWDSHCRNKHII